MRTTQLSLETRFKCYKLAQKAAIAGQSLDTRIKAYRAEPFMCNEVLLHAGIQSPEKNEVNVIERLFPELHLFNPSHLFDTTIWFIEESRKEADDIRALILDFCILMVKDQLKS